MNLSTTLITGIVAFGIGVVSGWIINQNRLEAKYNAEKVQLIESIREKEKTLLEANESLQTQLSEDKKNAEKVIANLKRDIANNKLRFTTNVRISDNSKLGFREERAELNRQTADDLLNITEEGDNAIRELNYCIDAYNSLRK